MSKPTAAQLHVSTPLTNLSVAYLQNTNSFVADKVFPIVPVEKQADKYFIYSQDDFNRDEAQLRAAYDESVGAGYAISTDTYYANNYAIHKDVADADRVNADEPIDMDRDVTEFLTHKLLIKREKLWASTYFTTGVWGTDISGNVNGAVGAGEAVYWNDYANSDPVRDVATGKTGILSATGYEANTLVLGYSVYAQLLNHPDIVDRVKYTGSNANAGRVNAQTLAQVFDVERVLVMSGIENTAKEGQTGTSAFIGGKHALLTYAAPRAGIMTPSAGYTFAWKGLLGQDAAGVHINKMRHNLKPVDRIEAEMAFDMKKVAASMGYFFNSIVQ